ncbi:hypothetical protein CHS0354_032824 [Potamilus streckersoni]|uniref:Uncharacterized protein n=1 Tax=Potamilus streckersoni TaxID=2493646 RepID=A0AAE0S936_9BIVA|nr:hypothetical protein CHS0354_032824 [Potamilus streckersoni]
MKRASNENLMRGLQVTSGHFARLPQNFVVSACQQIHQRAFITRASFLRVSPGDIKTVAARGNLGKGHVIVRVNVDVRVCETDLFRDGSPLPKLICVLLDKVKDPFKLEHTEDLLKDHSDEKTDVQRYKVGNIVFTFRSAAN